MRGLIVAEMVGAERYENCILEWDRRSGELSVFTNEGQVLLEISHVPNVRKTLEQGKIEVKLVRAQEA